MLGIVAIVGNDHGVGQDGLLSDEVPSPAPSTLEHRYGGGGYIRGPTRMDTVGAYMVGYGGGKGGDGQDGLLSEVPSPKPSTLEHRYDRDGNMAVEVLAFIINISQRN